MVFGYNLHYMAPFAIPRAGFCIVFRCASFGMYDLVFHIWYFIFGISYLVFHI